MYYSSDEKYFLYRCMHCEAITEGRLINADGECRLCGGDFERLVICEVCGKEFYPEDSMNNEIYGLDKSERCVCHKCTQDALNEYWKEYQEEHADEICNYIDLEVLSDLSKVLLKAFMTGTEPNITQELKDRLFEQLEEFIADDEAEVANWLDGKKAFYFENKREDATNDNR